MPPQSPGPGGMQADNGLSPQERPLGALKLPLGIIGLVVLALLLAGGYFYAPTPSSTDSDAQFIEAPTGLLVMAIAPLRDDGSTDWIFPTIYNLMLQELAYVPVDKLAASRDGVNLAYQHVFSHNGNFVVFTGAVNVDGATSLSSIPTQVYRADVSDALTYDDFVRKVQDAERITESSGIVQQFPSVSNVGDVLYITHVTEAENQALFTSKAESWDIRLVSHRGEERFLTKGIHPKWVDDSRFVFLKNDGLYLYDLAGGSGQKIWDMRGTATMRMSLDVSDDGQYVAWASPESGRVLILRALNWGTNSLTLKGALTTTLGMYAVFSPDSRFVAVQRPEPTDETLKNWMSVINIFDIETLTEASPPLPFVGSDPNVIYLTDWRP